MSVDAVIRNTTPIQNPTPPPPEYIPRLVNYYSVQDYQVRNYALSFPEEVMELILLVVVLSLLVGGMAIGVLAGGVG